MTSGAWKKSSPDLIARFAGALPAHPAVQRRPMFGYPCAFANGHMFCGLFQESALVRVGPQRAVALVAAGRATPFEPMAGRAMKAYVTVPESDARDGRALARWFDEALQFTLTLPPKASASTKKNAAPVSATKTSAARKAAAAKKTPASKARTHRG